MGTFPVVGYNLDCVSCRIVAQDLNSTKMSAAGVQTTHEAMPSLDNVPMSHREIVLDCTRRYVLYGRQ
jgi:hypothetical protein